VKRLLRGLVIVTWALVSAVAVHASSADADAALDKRVAAFSRQMRCLVCQNETLADSQADLAVDLRREIREQMKAGRSDDEITAFLTERYGDFIRYRPPLTRRTYALWFGPFILLAGVLVALSRRATRVPALASRSSLSSSDRKRARRILEEREVIDANVVVYRQQLAELEADRRDGIVTDDHFLIEQELLEERVLADLSGDPQRRAVASPTARTGALMYFLAIGLPLAAILIYLAIGAPGAIVHAP
jgi:cytochrome c-type biogenesis protein CcmH